jgi:hypothetical protein
MYFAAFSSAVNARALWQKDMLITKIRVIAIICLSFFTGIILP